MSYRLVFAVLGGALLVPAPGSADEPARPSADRIKLVHRMYEKLPGEILGVTEPIKEVRARAAFDGGSVHVSVLDAKGNKLGFRLDRQTQTRTPESLFLATKSGEVRLPARGPEESAVYGLLIRCSTKPPDGTPGETLSLLGDVLKVLDERFAGAGPVATEK